MPLSFLSLLMVLAMGQGLFLGAVLWTTRQAELRQANRLLATLVGLFVLVIGHAWLGTNGLFGRYPQAAAAIATLPLLVGPLLWLYLRGLLRGERLSRRSAWHFVPFALALLAWLPYYLQPAQAQLGVLAAHAPLAPFVKAFGGVKALSVLAYLLACHRLIANTEGEAVAQPLLRGLRRLTLLLGGGLALDALLFAGESLGLAMPVSSDTWGALVLVGFVYGLAFIAMRLPVGYLPPAPSVPAAVPRGPSPSLLSPQDQARFSRDLRASMEEQHAYRDGELSLEQLAQRLALTPHELSQLVNQSFGVNFQEYVNGYRLQAFKAAILDPQCTDDNILELALKSGFNSKSTMNRVFKKHVGMTPSQFRASQAAG